MLEEKNKNLAKLQLSNTIFISNNLLSTFYKDNALDIEPASRHLKDSKLLKYSLKDISKFIKDNQSNAEKILVFNTDIYLSYFVFIKDDTEIFDAVILGPYLRESTNEHMINKVAIKTKRFEDRDDLKDFYFKLPIINNKKEFYLRRSSELILKNEITYKFFDESFLAENISSLDYQNINAKEDENEDRWTESINEENLFFESLLMGKEEDLLEIFRRSIQPLFLKSDSKKQLRYAKNHSIGGLVVMSRKMIGLGADPKTILPYESKIIDLIEETTSIEELSALLEFLFINTARTIADNRSLEQLDMIEKAKIYVENHLSEHIKIKDVADYLGLSRNYFSSSFKKNFKLSFAEYLNKMRIKESKYLLINTDFPMSQIAKAVGFSSQHYFTKIFKQNENTTPLNYRIKNK